MPIIPKLRGIFYAVTAPIFLRRVGKGTMFFGNFRWANFGMNATIGRRCMIGYGVFMQIGRKASVVIGDYSSINTGCHVVASTKITIGSNVAIGEYVTIRDQDHLFTPKNGVRGEGFFSAPVIIEDNVWIGRGVHIGPGSLIQSGTIVAANSVVNGTVGPNELVAGAPAKAKRRIGPDGKRLPMLDD